MTDVKIRPCLDADTRARYVSDGPIDFETWLRLSIARDKIKPDTELVRGVIIDRMAAQYPHEWIFAWLFKVLGSFISYRKLGVLLGSRTAVKITGNDGRLPDLLFVRADNTAIIRKDAVYGIPDLVIEIVSENDRPYHLVALEADYRAIGVREILFIDPQRKRLRFLRGNESGYDEEYLETGLLEFVSVPGFVIEVEWLFADEKPDEFTLTRQLIEAAEA